MSRLIPVDDADLFRGLFVFTVPPFGKIIPKQTFHYPELCNEDLGAELMQQLPKFVFPYHEKSGVAIRRQAFTFAFTDSSGFYVFGYCLQEPPATPASEAECLCLVSQRPYGRLFERILSICGDIWYRSKQTAKVQIAELMSRLGTHYSLGLTPLSPTFSFKAEGASVKTYQVQCQENTSLLGYADPVVGDPAVATLLRVLGHANLLALFASALFERRIIVISDDLGVASGCVLGMERLCHPISWEGVFIPIMPNHLLDYCTAPMPFLVGVHSSNWKVVERMPLDDVVIVHADEDKVVTPFNDVDDLPSELLGKLKDEFKSVKKARNSVPDKQFATALETFISKLTGNFREHIRRKPTDGSVEVDWESLAASKPKGYTRTMELLGASQSLRSMLDRQIKELSNVSTPPKDALGQATVSTTVVNTLKAAKLVVGETSLAKRKTFSKGAHDVVKKFIASRPYLKPRNARVHVAVLLGSAKVDERQPSQIATAELVDRVLHPEYNSAPCASLIVIFDEVVFVLEEKTGKVLKEFSTTSILFCKTISSKAVVSTPLLVFITSQEGFVRHGHVVATKTEKHSIDAAHSLSSACHHLSSSIAGLPPLKAASNEEEEELNILIKRAFTVHFVGRYRVNDEADITYSWIQNTLKDQKPTESEHVLVVSADTVKLLNPFFKGVVHQNPTPAIRRVLHHEWPVVPDEHKKVTTASSMRMTDADRLNIMQKVREGSMTTEEATKHMLDTEEKLQDSCICIVWEDKNMECVECVVVVCTGGLKETKQICNDIEVLKSLAIKKGKDPFVPSVANNMFTSLPDTLRANELDRNKLSAVQLFRAGSLGNVYLANQTNSFLENGRPRSESRPRSDSRARLDSRPRSSSRPKITAPVVGPGWMKLRKKFLSKNDLNEIPVAVKLVNNTERADATTTFLKQTRIHIDLKHENVVSVVGVCLAHYPLLKICEFMQYGDLRTLLRTCKLKEFELSLREQTFVIQQLADGLAYIHSQRVVHNSVSCDHALVHEQCQVKIGGFAKARKYDADAAYYTQDETLSLAYVYMAPEAVPEVVFSAAAMEVPTTLTSKLSEMTDTWQFGVAMWEIFSYGKTPFADAKAHLVDVLRQIATKELRLTPPEGSNPHLAKLMESCTNNDPKLRPSFQKSSVLLDRIRTSLPPTEILRDVGHSVCPSSRGVLAKITSDIVKLRRKAANSLGLPDANEADSPRTERSASGSDNNNNQLYFALEDWRLDSSSNLVRVLQPEMTDNTTTTREGVSSNPFALANDTNTVEWNPFLDSPPPSTEPPVQAENNNVVVNQRKPTTTINPFATNPFAEKTSSKGQNPYSAGTNPNPFNI
eukprot:m.153825 g.153825  ORF g.153825 m.153825 type:complete len:1339 (+) comp30853_c0_seq1:194-4210(+)